MSNTNIEQPATPNEAQAQPGSLHPDGSASEADVIRKEHAAIAAAYEAQRDTPNGSGLPYGPCLCSMCAGGKTPNDKVSHSTPPSICH